MGKPYWNGPQDPADRHTGARRFAGRYATKSDGGDSAGADSGYQDSSGYGRSAATDTFDRPGHDGYQEYQNHERYPGYGDSTDFRDSTDYHEAYEDYEDYEAYDDDYLPDNRWRWIAAAAGAVLLIAIVAIAFGMRGGDAAPTASSKTPSASTSVPQDAVSTTPRTVIATVPPTSAAPSATLPPETVVTVTTTPTAAATPPAPAPPAAAAPPAPSAQSITYTVTGTRSLFDLVTIIYSDEQGFPRTDINVALPWSKTVVLNPGVETKSLTATSLTGQLNCAITDSAGAVIRQQTNNSAVAVC